MTRGILSPTPFKWWKILLTISEYRCTIILPPYPRDLTSALSQCLKVSCSDVTAFFSVRFACNFYQLPICSAVHCSRSCYVSITHRSQLHITSLNIELQIIIRLRHIQKPHEITINHTSRIETGTGNSLLLIITSYNNCSICPLPAKLQNKTINSEFSELYNLLKINNVISFNVTFLEFLLISFSYQ